MAPISVNIRARAPDCWPLLGDPPADVLWVPEGVVLAQRRYPPGTATVVPPRRARMLNSFACSEDLCRWNSEFVSCMQQHVLNMHAKVHTEPRVSRRGGHIVLAIVLVLRGSTPVKDFARASETLGKLGNPGCPWIALLGNLWLPGLRGQLGRPGEPPPPSQSEASCVLDLPPSEAIAGRRIAAQLRPSPMGARRRARGQVASALGVGVPALRDLSRDRSGGIARERREKLGQRMESAQRSPPSARASATSRASLSAYLATAPRVDVPSASAGSVAERDCRLPHEGRSRKDEPSLGPWAAILGCRSRASPPNPHPERATRYRWVADVAERRGDAAPHQWPWVAHLSA